MFTSVSQIQKNINILMYCVRSFIPLLMNEIKPNQYLLINKYTCKNNQLRVLINRQSEDKIIIEKQKNYSYLQMYQRLLQQNIILSDNQMEIQEGCGLISPSNQDNTPSTTNRKENSANNLGGGGYNVHTQTDKMEIEHYEQSGLLNELTLKEMISTNQEGLQLVYEHSGKYRGETGDMQLEQKGILEEAQFLNSFIDKKKEKMIMSLQFYFNDASKLDEYFAQIAAEALNRQQYYQDKNSPSCSYASNWISPKRLAESYFIFSNYEQKVVRPVKKSRLQEWIRPDDVIQGDVMDSYLLAAMAALANQQPKMVYRLFVLHKNPAHIYGVRLFKEGKWQIVTLDLQFPINQNGLYCGVRPNGNKIWAMLLQKAYAKINGSYDKIQFGTGLEGLQVWTGAPSILYEKKNFHKIKIRQQFQRGSIMTASLTVTKSKQQQIKVQQQGIKSVGLVAKHTYSILGIFSKVIGADKRQTTLVKLRSPLGKSDMVWKGQWDINSQLWTEQLRNQLGYTGNSKDASFFMCQEDFAKYFSFVNISRVQQNNTNSWLDIKCKSNELVALDLQIGQRGNYSFTLYLKGRRSYAKDYIFSKRCSWLYLFKKHDNKFKQVCNCVFQINNTIQGFSELEVGKYTIVLQAKWLHDQGQQYCLSSYGPRQVWMRQTEYKGYLQSFNQVDESVEWKHVDVQNKERNVLKRVKFDPSSCFGFIEIINGSTMDYEARISFKNYSELYTTFLTDHEFPLRLQVAAKHKVTCKFMSANIFRQESIYFEKDSFKK